MNSRAEELYRLEEMIEVIPSWYERWGITLLSFVVCFVLTTCSLYQIPNGIERTDRVLLPTCLL